MPPGIAYVMVQTTMKPTQRITDVIPRRQQERHTQRTPQSGWTPKQA
jgi:hypothetical protein